MTTLFAFLHHLCAFTLVAAVAIEFTLIKQELTFASARRLQVTDIVLGGIVSLGSNVSTLRQTEAAIGAAEARRSDLIDAIDLRAVDDAPAKLM